MATMTKGRWWRTVGERLGCNRCRNGPPRCDRCEVVEAVSVCEIVADARRDGLVALRGRHLHLCAACRDELQQRSGVPRLELGSL